MQDFRGGGTVNYVNPLFFHGGGGGGMKVTACKMVSRVLSLCSGKCRIHFCIKGKIRNSHKEGEGEKGERHYY